MSDTVNVMGFVLSAMPIGEYDKRLVLETDSLGKITAFASHCRGKKSSLLAATNPFAMGEFILAPSGRDAYRVISIIPKEYFRELTDKIPQVYIGFYFLDLVDYYGREGINGRDTLNLLYLCLKALTETEIDKNLVRRIFELRIMTINGDFAPGLNNIDESTGKICNHIMKLPLNRLFSFTLTDKALENLGKYVDYMYERTVDRTLKSRKIMEDMLKE